jgi:hypothetical protein
MDDLSRAVKTLIGTYGKDAARVAEQRAMNAELGGSGASAYIWRQVAAAIRERQRSERSTGDDEPR